jgi:hypothetical protein
VGRQNQRSSFSACNQPHKARPVVLLAAFYRTKSIHMPRCHPAYASCIPKLPWALSCCRGRHNASTRYMLATVRNSTETDSCRSTEPLSKCMHQRVTPQTSASCIRTNHRTASTHLRPASAAPPAAAPSPPCDPCHALTAACVLVARRLVSRSTSTNSWQTAAPLNTNSMRARYTTTNQHLGCTVSQQQLITAIQHLHCQLQLHHCPVTFHVPSTVVNIIH